MYTYLRICIINTLLQTDSMPSSCTSSWRWTAAAFEKHCLAGIFWRRRHGFGSVLPIWHCTLMYKVCFRMMQYFEKQQQQKRYHSSFSFLLPYHNYTDEHLSCSETERRMKRRAQHSITKALADHAATTWNCSMQQLNITRQRCPPPCYQDRRSCKNLRGRGCAREVMSSSINGGEVTVSGYMKYTLPGCFCYLLTINVYKR